MRRHIRHACDSCKRRKAKCDGEPPTCSSCRALGMECKYSIPRAKRGPKPRAARTSSAQTGGSPYSPNHHIGTSVQHDAQSSTIIPSTSPTTTQEEISSPWATSVLTPTPTGDWPGTPLAPPQIRCPQKVHDYLTSVAEYHHVNLELVVRQCIDFYCAQTFAILPVFLPRAIIQSIPLLLPAARQCFAPTWQAGASGASGDREPRGRLLENMRTFTWLTAFCAHTHCRTRDEAQLVDETLADAFLSASRGMLSCYEDSDIAQPVTNSPLVRLCHAASLHFKGKNRMSRSLVGQALRLVVDMRMFDESSYEGLEPEEAQIRRNLFWILYTSDKSSSFLNKLPLTLFERLNDPSQLELSADGSPVRLLDDLAGASYQAPFEEQLRPGFDLSNRQWLLAGDIVRDLDILTSLGAKSPSVFEGLASLTSNVTRNYTAFCSLLDITPSWVSDPKSYTVEDGDEETTETRRRAFWTQHANLIVTMHCLKLILMVRAHKQGFAALMGFVENEELFALRSTEVACELVNDSTRVPISALRANGEAIVEKLRSVGVILLEISHRVSNEAIVTRAKALFTRLLDLIARLDSKTSDNLGGEAP